MFNDILNLFQKKYGTAGWRRTLFGRNLTYIRSQNGAAITMSVSKNLTGSLHAHCTEVFRAKGGYHYDHYYRIKN